ncbi:type I toxin-antitoxin system Fst family toxin [Selenomonas ruminantium]|nr:type I toxin-antitoxin system Fst family toxin [Selenomonas ruminantium]
MCRLEKGGESRLSRKIVELILAPLIVGILVSLFNYWLNH